MTALLTVKRVLPLLLLNSCLAEDCLDPERAAEREGARRAAAAWIAPCTDQSWLLATTAGSPSHAVCPNQRHRMHVQVATTSSNEEVGALVFCECQREFEDAGR